MSSTTRPLTWPTTAELDKLTACFEGDGADGPMQRICDLQDTLNRLINLDVAPSIEEVQDAIERGAEPLTVEHVGALSSCLAKLRFDIDHMSDAVRDMERQRDVMALEVVPCPKGGDDA